MVKASGKSCLRSVSGFQHGLASFALAALAAALSPALSAQAAPPAMEENATNALLDAPDTHWDASGQTAPTVKRIAKPFDKQVEPETIAPRLTVGDKILLGIRATVSPFAVSGWLAGASISEARDSRPNYPDTIGGFGQRLGAAAARSSSDTLITDSILSPVFHEDPRYYKLGTGHGVWERTGYAVTRVFVTRTDGGKLTPHFALLIGDVAGASLTQLYYPQVNRGVGDVAKTYATSLAAAGAGFFVREFIGKWLYVLHIRPNYS